MLQCSDRSLYTGVTTDLDRRVQRHNEGVGARYTRSRLPVELVYTESVADRSTALRRESKIKRMTAAEKRELLSA